MGDLRDGYRWGNQQNITNNRFPNYAPSWLPDGKHIAFHSWRENNLDIYVINADGSNPRNLTSHPEDDSAPAWSSSAFAVAPAGKRLTIWGQLKQIDR